MKAAPAKKTATKKAPAAKTPAVKVVKAKVATSKKFSQPKAEKAAPQAAPQAAVAEHYSEVLSKAKAITMSDVRKNPHAILQLAEHGVQTGTSVLNTMTELKNRDPAMDVTDAVEAASQTLKASLHLTSLVLEDLSSGLEGHSVKSITAKTVIHTDAPTTSLNGSAEPPVAGTPTYEAPSQA